METVLSGVYISRLACKVCFQLMCNACITSVLFVTAPYLITD